MRSTRQTVVAAYLRFFTKRILDKAVSHSIPALQSNAKVCTPRSRTPAGSGRERETNRLASGASLRLILVWRRSLGERRGERVESNVPDRELGAVALDNEVG